MIGAGILNEAASIPYAFAVGVPSGRRGEPSRRLSRLHFLVWCALPLSQAPVLCAGSGFPLRGGTAAEDVAGIMMDVVKAREMQPANACPGHC